MNDLSNEDLRKALDIAIKEHSNKKRYNKKPYIVHPIAVYQIAKYFGYSLKVQVISLLHDTIEDADDPFDIEQQISKFFPSLLHHVKKLTNRKCSNYVKYVKSLSGVELQVKMCDILHNLLDSPRKAQFDKYKRTIEALKDKSDISLLLSRFHWRILNDLIINPITRKIKTSNDHLAIFKNHLRIMMEVYTLPSAKERFDLRRTSSLFMKEVFDMINAQKHYFENFKIKLYYEHKECEIILKNGRDHIEKIVLIEEDELLERIESLGHFDITVQVEKSVESKSFIDARYEWDEDDQEQLGGIFIGIQISEFMDSALLFKKARAILAHELQHIIQRVLYGSQMSYSSRESLDNHMRDPDEIDARIEEIIAFSDSDNICVSIEEFRTALKTHIHEYLLRNEINSEHELYNAYTLEMLETHTLKYREKFERWS